MGTLQMPVTLRLSLLYSTSSWLNSMGEKVVWPPCELDGFLSSPLSFFSTLILLGILPFSRMTAHCLDTSAHQGFGKFRRKRFSS